MSGAPQWTVPAPLATGAARMADETEIVVRRHGDPDGPRLVLSHANGFAVDAYYPFWSLLVDRFDIVVFDLRNHGWNPVGALESHAIPTFAHDMTAVAQAIDVHFGPKPAVGVFHSLSGQAAAIEACSGAASFAALVLFDPFICPQGCHPDDRERLRTTMERMAEGARRRRNSFESVAAFAQRLRKTPAFEQLRPGVAELLAQTTLRREDAEGEESGSAFVLRCPREYEARICEQAYECATTVDADAIGCPVTVIGSDPVAPHSFLPTVEMDEIAALNYDFVPETTHFLQLEEPEACVAATLEFIGDHTELLAGAP